MRIVFHYENHPSPNNMTFAGSLLTMCGESRQHSFCSKQCQLSHHALSSLNTTLFVAIDRSCKRNLISFVSVIFLTIKDNTSPQDSLFSIDLFYFTIHILTINLCQFVLLRSIVAVIVIGIFVTTAYGKV